MKRSHILIYSLQLLAMKRVGILHGGMPHALDEKVIPPSQRLRIMRYSEMGSSDAWGSATAVSDGEGLLG